MISRKILNLSLYNYKATILNQPPKSLDFWSDFFGGNIKFGAFFTLEIQNKPLILLICLLLLFLNNCDTIYFD